MKTTRKFLLALAFLGIVGLVASCTKEDNNSLFSMSNQDFITQAASSNLFEVAAGNLAVQKSGNANVKAYGEHMKTDHTQATTEMSTLANQKGWSIPTSMLKKHQDKIDALTALTGVEFDRQYAMMMVVSHQETIALFESAARDSGVPDYDLRIMAAGKLPTLKEHLQHAQQLQTQVQ